MGLLLIRTEIVDALAHRSAVWLPPSRTPDECSHQWLDPWCGNEVLRSMVRADAIQVRLGRREK